MKMIVFTVAFFVTVAGFCQQVFAGGESSTQAVDSNVDVCLQSPWLSICDNAERITLIDGVDGSNGFVVAVWTGCDEERLFEVTAKEDGGGSYFFQEGTAELIFEPSEIEPRIYWGDDEIKLILPNDFSTINMGKVPICRNFNL